MDPRERKVGHYCLSSFNNRTLDRRFNHFKNVLMEPRLLPNELTFPLRVLPLTRLPPARLILSACRLAVWGCSNKLRSKEVLPQYANFRSVTGLYNATLIIAGPLFAPRGGSLSEFIISESTNEILIFALIIRFRIYMTAKVSDTLLLLPSKISGAS